MAPFLLLGFLLAGILHVWVPNHLYRLRAWIPFWPLIRFWAGPFCIPGVHRLRGRVEWHDGHDVDESALKKAVEDAGFEFGGRV